MEICKVIAAWPHKEGESRIVDQARAAIAKATGLPATGYHRESAKGGAMTREEMEEIKMIAFWLLAWLAGTTLIGLGTLILVLYLIKWIIMS